MGKKFSFTAPIKAPNKANNYGRDRRDGHTYKPNQVAVYEQTIGEYAALAMRNNDVDKLTSKKIAIRLTFGWKPYRYKSEWRLPDVDGGLKATLDGLEGIVFDNDEQLITQSSRKVPTDNPFVRVAIWDLSR